MKPILSTALLILLASCAGSQSTNNENSDAPRVFTNDGKAFEYVGDVNLRPSEDPSVNPELTFTPAPKGNEPKSSKPNSAAQACLAEAMYFEAKGTGERGMRAVGEVVLNRTKDSRFPNSVCGVVDQRYNGSCQFSYRCDGKPEIYANRGQKALAERIAGTLLSNRGADITNGALFFHSARIKPGWFGTLSRRGRFGGNIFYR